MTFQDVKEDQVNGFQQLSAEEMNTIQGGESVTITVLDWSITIEWD